MSEATRLEIHRRWLLGCQLGGIKGRNTYALLLDEHGHTGEGGRSPPPRGGGGGGGSVA